MKHLCCLLVSLGMLGCAGGPSVTRVVDGHVVEGPFVEPEAYAAFLRGAMAEARGDLPGALREYEAITGIDDDPELWTRVGELRCRINPKDDAAWDALNRAVRKDAEYAPAWAARARCASMRGERRAAASDAERAAALDPRDSSSQVLLSQLEPARPAGERLVAVTLRAPAASVGWRALGAWARGHRDAVLAAHAYGELARLSEDADDDVAQVVLDLSGEGELWAARMLAGALVDARREHDRESATIGEKTRRMVSLGTVVARLAVDDALARMNDLDRARRRAVSGHLGIDVLAARALLVGRVEAARDLAESLVHADPRSASGRLLLATAAYEAGDAEALAKSMSMTEGASSAAVPADVLLPFARVVTRAVGPDAARLCSDLFAMSPMPPGDTVLTAVAVALAEKGALPRSLLSAEGQLELALRMGGELPKAAAQVDARHRLLWLAFTRPDSKEANALLRHLGAAWQRDPLIAAVRAKMSLAGVVPSEPGLPSRIAAVDASDSLLARAALALAQKRGDESQVRTLRARLAALSLQQRAKE